MKIQVYFRSWTLEPVHEGGSGSSPSVIRVSSIAALVAVFALLFPTMTWWPRAHQNRTSCPCAMGVWMDCSMEGMVVWPLHQFVPWSIPRATCELVAMVARHELPKPNKCKRAPWVAANLASVLNWMGRNGNQRVVPPPDYDHLERQWSLISGGAHTTRHKLHTVGSSARDVKMEVNLFWFLHSQWKPHLVEVDVVVWERTD